MKSLDELLAEYIAHTTSSEDECPACGGPCEFPDHVDAERPREHDVAVFVAHDKWMRAWLQSVQDDAIASSSLAIAGVVLDVVAPTDDDNVPPAVSDMILKIVKQTIDLTRKACAQRVCALHERAK